MKESSNRRQNSSEKKVEGRQRASTQATVDTKMKTKTRAQQSSKIPTKKQKGRRGRDERVTPFNYFLLLFGIRAEPEEGGIGCLLPL